MTHLRPETEDALYPGLMDGLRLAYQQNLQNGLVAPPPQSLGTIAMASVRERGGMQAEAGRLSDLDPSFHMKAEVARGSTATLFERIGLNTPELSDFMHAGIDFGRVGAAYQTMDEMDLEPELVFAPLLEPGVWGTLFRTLQDDPKVNRDGDIRNGGLYIENTVGETWDTPIGRKRALDIEGQRWQVVILPGANMSPLSKVDYAGRPLGSEDIAAELDDQVAALIPETVAHIESQQKELNKHNPLGSGRVPLESLALQKLENYLHPSLSSYLTLQARRLQGGRYPIDRVGNSTWLDSFLPLPGRQHAIIGAWNGPKGWVDIRSRSVDYHVLGLGIRLPVWGDPLFQDIYESI